MISLLNSFFLLFNQRDGLFGLIIFFVAKWGKTSGGNSAEGGNRTKSLINSYFSRVAGKKIPCHIRLQSGVLYY